MTVRNNITPGWHRTALAVGLLCMTILLLSGGCQKQNPQELLNAGIKHLRSGDTRTAAIVLRQALELDPTNLRVHQLLGQAFLLMDDPVAAMLTFTSLRQLAAPEEAWLPGLSLALIRQALPERARQILRIRPDQKPELKETMLVHLAFAAIQLKEMHAAQLYLNLAAGLGLDSAQLHLGNAEFALAERDLGEAYLSTERALEREPGFLNAWLLRAESARLFGNLDLALEHFESAISLAPDSPRARLGHAATAIGLGRFGDAESDIKEVQRRFGKRSSGDFLLAMIRYEQSDTEDAEFLLKQIISSHPQHGASLMLLGLIKYNDGYYNQAQIYLQQYHLLEPLDLEAIKVLAAALVKIGQVDLANELLTSNQVAGADDAQYMAMLGSTMLQLGDSANGLKWLARAVEADATMGFMFRQIAVSGSSDYAAGPGVGSVDSGVVLDSDLFEVDQMRAQALLFERDYDGAMKAAMKIAVRHPDLPYPQNLIGAVAYASGSLDLARRHWQKALEIDPAHFDATINLAHLAYEQAQMETAIALYTDALVINPGHRTASLQLAALKLAAGDPSAARDLLQAGLPDAGADTEYLSMLARTHAEIGNFSDAASIYHQIDATTVTVANRTALAFSLQKAGMSEQAAEVRMAMSAPGQTQEMGIVAAFLALQADDEEAIQHITALRERFSNNGTIDYLEGEYHFRNKDWVQARGAFEHALIMAPSSTVAQRLALTMIADHDQTAAIQHLHNWLEHHADDAHSWWILGDSLRTTSDWQGAAEAYRQALDRLGPEPTLLNNLAWTLGEMQEPGAIDIAEQALGMAPERADIADTAGWIHYRQGNFDRARELLNRAVTRDPGNVLYKLHLAEVLGTTADIETALLVLDQASRMADAGAMEQIARIRDSIEKLKNTR